jgi:hypothetical protein
MLSAGLDLSRKRVDVCLRGLAARLAGHGQPIRAAIESTNGARFVRDELEQLG